MGDTGFRTQQRGRNSNGKRSHHYFAAAETTGNSRDVVELTLKKTKERSLTRQFARMGRTRSGRRDQDNWVHRSLVIVDRLMAR